MKITIEELQEYLFDHYKNGGIDQSLFMKLVEEIGEMVTVHVDEAIDGDLFGTRV